MLKGYSNASDWITQMVWKWLTILFKKPFLLLVFLKLKFFCNYPALVHLSIWSIPCRNKIIMKWVDHEPLFGDDLKANVKFQLVYTRPFNWQINNINFCNNKCNNAIVWMRDSYFIEKYKVQLTYMSLDLFEKKYFSCLPINSLFAEYWFHACLYR